MEASDSAKPYIIDTASGMRLDLDNPRLEDIRIEDVSGGLSQVCRFGAQTREHYSVAQHTLHVHRLVVEAGILSWLWQHFTTTLTKPTCATYLLPLRGKSEGYQRL